MTDTTPATVKAIRAASRDLVRKLGFLGDDLAESGLPPSAVHALIEIGDAGHMTAKDLRGLLDLEKSSVSRMLRKLVQAGLLAEQTDEADARAKRISLTAAGKAKLSRIDAFARSQVGGALARLAPGQDRTILQGLQLYADALSKGPLDRVSEALPLPVLLAASHSTALQAPDSGISPLPSLPQTGIVTGYRPGLIGRCCDLHARYYARTVGFGRAFEAIVANGLADFCTRLDRPGNQVWTAIAHDQIVGTIAIDGEDLNRHGQTDSDGDDRAGAGTGTAKNMGDGTGMAGRIAHLRWFIVDDDLRGSGLGRRLLSTALAFVDHHDFTETHLWTFRGLDAARKLYEAHGFALADEYQGRQWGNAVMEQKFVRPRHTAIGAGGGGRTRTAEAEGF